MNDDYCSGWLLGIILHGSVGEECNTSKELMSILYPLMYLEVMCVFGTHPAFNIYISLFWGVLKSYIVYLLIYGLFLICFAVGYLQMFNQAESTEEKLGWPSDFFFLFMHVFNMFLGTLELASIQWADPEIGDTMKVQLIYVLIFAVLIMLTLLNLLNALAIEDVNRMIDKSATDRLYTILRLAVFWEERFRKLASPSRICSVKDSSDSCLGDCFKVLPDKKLYFKAYQNKEVKFSLMNLATYGFSNCRTLDGYTSPSGEDSDLNFSIPKKLADQAIEIVHDRTSQELRQKEKDERNLFYENVLNNSVSTKKEMEKKIAKIEGDISTILELLQQQSK